MQALVIYLGVLASIVAILGGVVLVRWVRERRAEARRPKASRAELEAFLRVAGLHPYDRGATVQRVLEAARKGRPGNI